MAARFTKATPNPRSLFALWRLYAKMDLVWISRDFRSAIFFYVAELIQKIAAVSGVILLAERFAGLGQWSKPQVIFMLGYTMLGIGLLDTFFNYNVSYVSRRIGRGQFDHTLIQPRPLWVILVTEGFTPFTGSVVFLPGAALVLWSVGRLELNIGPLWIAQFGVNLLASAAITLAFSSLWGCLAFWAPRAAEEISMSALQLIDQLRPFPLDGLAPVLVGGLLTAVPAGFVGWFPARALLGLDQAPGAHWATPAAALMFGAIAAWTFAKGLKQYGRTGSQRYSSFGHRR